MDFSKTYFQLKEEIQIRKSVLNEDQSDLYRVGLIYLEILVGALATQLVCKEEALLNYLKEKKIHEDFVNIIKGCFYDESATLDTLAALINNKITFSQKKNSQVPYSPNQNNRSIHTSKDSKTNMTPNQQYRYKNNRQSSAQNSLQVNSLQMYLSKEKQDMTASQQMELSQPGESEESSGERAQDGSTNKYYLSSYTHKYAENKIVMKYESQRRVKPQPGENPAKPAANGKNEPITQFEQIPITTYDSLSRNKFKLPNYQWQIMDVLDVTPLKHVGEQPPDVSSYDTFELLMLNRSFVARVKDLNQQKSFVMKMITP